jgi:flagellar motor switch protein FliN/FliY
MPDTSATAPAAPSAPAAAGAPGPTGIRPAQFADLGSATPVTPGSNNLDLVRDIQVRLSVELGRTEMVIQDILELTAGKVIELDRLAGEPLDIMVNGKLLAKGEVVVVDENFGVRITSIIDTRAREAALSGEVAKKKL